MTRTLSQSLADTNFIGQSPKYLLECVAGAALIACAALAARGAVGSAWLAQLTFIGFAGFRLLPAGQQMYHAFVVIRANRATIESLASQLEHRTAARKEPAGTAATPMPFRSIGISGVSFRYAPETPWVLADVSLRIAAGAAVGIVGPSGCGKTTLVDLLVGLMLPTSGRIEIDGETLDPQRVEAWQQTIGYVPQEVMILDATVRENIAFGVDPAEIDDERVRAAAKQAGAAAFIESLPGGFLARTSGVSGSLSGGQRQRLGIARALYRNPSLLVLDEATNSLDADTERAIIDTVVRNRGSRTLVIVAHGDSVIGACDQVYELRNGRLHERAASPVRLRWGVNEHDARTARAAPSMAAGAHRRQGVQAGARRHREALAQARPAIGLSTGERPARAHSGGAGRSGHRGRGPGAAATAPGAERTQACRGGLPGADAPAWKHHRGDLVRRPAACLQHAGIDCHVLPPCTATAAINAAFEEFQPNVFVAAEATEDLRALDLLFIFRYKSTRGCLRLLVPVWHAGIPRAWVPGTRSTPQLDEWRRRLRWEGLTADAHFSIFEAEFHERFARDPAGPAIDYVSIPQACNPFVDYPLAASKRHDYFMAASMTDDRVDVARATCGRSWHVTGACGQDRNGASASSASPRRTCRCAMRSRESR